MEDENNTIYNSLLKIYTTINNSKITEIILIITCVIGVALFTFELLGDGNVSDENQLLFQIYLQKSKVSIYNEASAFADVASLLGAAILAVWAFSVSLIVFYLGRMEDRKYGIRIIDIMLEDLGLKKIRFMVIYFVLQLLLLLLAISFGKIYTLFYLSCIQIVIMLYIFLMICMECSNSYIQKEIKESVVNYINSTEKEKDKVGFDWKLSKMIMAMNYKDQREVHILLRLYYDILQDKNVKNILQDKNVKNKKRNKIKQFSKDFLIQIIQTCDNEAKTEQIVFNLLEKTEAIVAQQGLIEAIVDEGSLSRSEKILRIEFQNRRKILLWAMGYCIYCSYHITAKPSEYYRSMVVVIVTLFEEGYKDFSNADFNMLTNFWTEIHKNTSKSSKVDICSDILIEELQKVGIYLSPS